jgi:hypothetical protein
MKIASLISDKFVSFWRRADRFESATPQQAADISHLLDLDCVHS